MASAVKLKDVILKIVSLKLVSVSLSWHSSYGNIRWTQTVMSQQSPYKAAGGGIVN